MIAQIAKALGSGYTSKQVIDYILKKFPAHADKIKDALAAGFTADQVVKYISGDKKNLNKTFSQPDSGSQTAHERALSGHMKKRDDINDTAKKGAFLAAGSIAAPMAASALQRAIPSNLAGLIPGTQQQQPPTQPSQSPMGPGPNSPGIQVMPSPPPPPMGGAGAVNPMPSNQTQSPTIPQPTQSLQPIQPQRDVKKSVDIIKSTGQEATVKNLLEGGLSPSEIKDTLGVIIGKSKLKELEKATGGIEQAIEDYASSIQQAQPEAPQELSQQLTNPEMPIEQIAPNGMLESEVTATEPTQEMPDVQVEEEPKPIAKMDTVSTPQGIGSVKEIRNGKAIVEVDGKLHKVDEADIEKPLFTDDEIADAYDRVMAVTPEEHKSSFISWAGYDPETKVLGYIPRGGKYEELHNITPEEAELIKTGKGVARTSGENREGMHIIGGDTRGLISQIQHDRRRKREAEDKKQLRLFEEPKREKENKGMLPIYDEMAYPRGLSQARDKKKADEARALKKKAKEAEKERLKKEKDEAKKRKKQA